MFGIVREAGRARQEARGPIISIDEDAAAPTDAELLHRSRQGDRRAYSELWRRYSPIAVAYARSLGAAPPDPEDVVSDAFLSILQLLRAGRGPEERFRPYLLTTVRNTWMTAARRTPTTVPLEDVEPPHSLIGTIEPEAMVDSAALAEAFCALPERWQHALWLSQVERLPPREIAEALGLRANAVSALTYRARDGLRKAWISAHLRRAPAGSVHARVIELLGAYAQGDLGPRPQKFVTEHLASCADCREAAGEARRLARAITLGPLLVGGAGLVIAPGLFSVGEASAAVAVAAPVLWPAAAAVAVALAVGGGLLVRTPPAPDAAGAGVPAVALPAREAPKASSDDVLPAPASFTLPDRASVVPGPPTATPPPGRAPAIPPIVPAPAAPSDPPPVDGGGERVDHAVPDAPAAESSRSVAPSPTSARTVASTWYLSVTVEQVTADPACQPIARISVSGSPGALVAVLIDGDVVGTPGELAPDGAWYGEVTLPAGVRHHTVSLHHVDANGDIGELIVQTEIAY
ncbi:sigma-70 family RNA polymerase sigma factor [Microbacterium sp. SA39]|uniref:sigma-70 family RNA polymerase sigma factor n=1 Tax=Microbacterium sp. SA39 TaxID=1263625 RepID=UPI0005FA9129|nr:sigma-70 family RNA polymerase sigma factor [Microbacterium sp. SA39]KJQ53825.1 RNA polymerase sigma factor [Microbacterium sp. SA39]